MHSEREKKEKFVPVGAVETKGNGKQGKGRCGPPNTMARSVYASRISKDMAVLLTEWETELQQTTTRMSYPLYSVTSFLVSSSDSQLQCPYLSCKPISWCIQHVLLAGCNSIGL